MSNEWKACACEKCVDMCKRRPCWGTPDEIEQLIQLGYGDRFMLDYWTDSYNGDLDIISPAIVGYEGERAPFWPNGRCALLTPDGKCEVHDSGFKPKEGRIVNCKEEHPELHKSVAMAWDSDKGRELVGKWRGEK